MLKALGTGILSCLLPLSISRMDSLLGILNWAYRPLPGFILFAGPWYNWRWQKPRRRIKASQNQKTLLLDLLILAWGGWKAPMFFPSLFTSPFIFSDAACINDTYQVGLFSPFFGTRFFQCPPWIVTQQQAEYYGLIQATKIALYIGWPSLSLIGDNLAALFSFLKLKPFVGQWKFMKMLRGLFNFMFSKGLFIFLSWLPTELIPADPISRINCELLVSIEQAVFDAHARFHRFLQMSSTLRPLGNVQLTPILSLSPTSP